MLATVHYLVQSIIKSFRTKRTMEHSDVVSVVWQLGINFLLITRKHFAIYEKEQVLPTTTTTTTTFSHALVKEEKMTL